MNKHLGFHFAGPKAPEPVRRDSIQPGMMYSHTDNPGLRDVYMVIDTNHVALDACRVRKHPLMAVNVALGTLSFSHADQVVYPLSVDMTARLTVEEK